MKKLLGILVLSFSFFFEANADKINFSGTVWKIYDLQDGDIQEVEFHKSGKCAYTNIRSASGNEGKSYSISEGNCRWTQIGDDKIRYDFNNNFMVRNAKLTSSNLIEGTYITKHSEGIFRFTGELISYNQDPIIKEPKKSSPNDDKIVPAGSGSGFFVTYEGHTITNYHVIEGCDINKLSFKGSQTEVKVLAVDKVNDIAILKSNAKPDVIFPVSNEDVSLLEDVIVAGFPLGKKISSAIKTHKGVVTALAGAGDNYSFFQTDAAINQGNSGGPIINQKGNVVGIAVATWVEEGVQGVHFGIKSSTLKTFASANGLSFASPNFRDQSNKALGELITKGTVYVECHMTVAKIKKMIAQAENRKAFFKEHK